jgi:UrcA family protein
MVRRPLILAAFAAALLAPAAHAQHWGDDGELRQTAVQIADLDLSTRAGVDELDRRIGRAVDRICEGDRECRDGAWASTYEQAQAAIARDEWMRHMAAEREAELRACAWQGCRSQQAQAPAYYPPPMPAYGGATVIVITTGYPPPQVTVYR